MKKIFIPCLLTSTLILSSPKVPINLNLTLGKQFNSVKAEYTSNISLQKGEKNNFSHKFSLGNDDFTIYSTLNHTKILNSFNIGTQNSYLPNTNFKLTNNFTFDYALNNTNIYSTSLQKNDYIVTDELKVKYMVNDNIELHSGAFVQYVGRKTTLKTDVPIKEGYVRMHFKKIADTELDDPSSRGLWLWGYTDEASDSGENNNGYPKNKKKFRKIDKDDFGYYIDIKKKTGNCNVNDYNCENKKIGFFIVNGDTNQNGNEKYPKPADYTNSSDSSDRYLEIINKNHNEVWVNENLSITNHNQYILSGKDKILIKEHELKRDYWDNEKEINKNETYLKLNPNAPDSVKKPYLDKLEKLYNKRNNLTQEIDTFHSSLSNKLIYGFNLGLKYTKSHFTFNTNAKIKNEKYLGIKNTSKWFVNLDNSIKYDYISNKFTITPELETNLNFNDIKRTSTIYELILNPKISLNYAFNKKFDITAQLEIPVKFNNTSSKFKFKDYSVKPTLNINYLW